MSNLLGRRCRPDIFGMSPARSENLSFKSPLRLRSVSLCVARRAESFILDIREVGEFRFLDGFGALPDAGALDLVMDPSRSVEDGEPLEVCEGEEGIMW